ncbi:MAG: aminotransferase class V-fold PLP-dependent enzyme [Oscillospiraceae bacterium]|nr:aminotransferase class V-fold PLP-dependent enzyme [Oscillospiraceae bacterium]
MYYLDHGATSFPKPEQVTRAVLRAMEACANPGRGSHPPAELAAEGVFSCRCAAGELFSCLPEQVVFTQNCTQGLNIAIRTLVRPGDRVVISGFEHNAVTRPLHGLGARITVAGRRLFDPADTLRQFRNALNRGAKAAVFTHVSNVFGYVLPVEEMAAECRRRRIPFVIDAAQSAGVLPIDAKALGADFIAMPGHKGLLGPMGTGILICNRLPKPLIMGGTGSESERQEMPDLLPDRAEAGTLNVPGILGLEAGLRRIQEVGPERIKAREQALLSGFASVLRDAGMEVFAGKNQVGALSFRPGCDCQEGAARLAGQGFALRAGLHCAPLAHRSAGTLETGTIRLSVGMDTPEEAVQALGRAVQTSLPPYKY